MMSLNIATFEVPSYDDEPQFTFTPYVPEEPASPCDDCFGACCRSNMILELTRKEARMLADAGTEMLELPKSEWQFNPSSRRAKFYQFAGNCAFLDEETFECTNYDNRPSICRDFKAGTPTCESVKTRQAERLGMVIETLV